MQCLNTEVTEPPSHQDLLKLAKVKFTVFTLNRCEEGEFEPKISRVILSIYTIYHNFYFTLLRKLSIFNTM